jgi:hypothetical protein
MSNLLLPALVAAAAASTAMRLWWPQRTAQSAQTAQKDRLRIEPVRPLGPVREFALRPSRPFVPASWTAPRGYPDPLQQPAPLSRALEREAPAPVYREPRDTPF